MAVPHILVLRPKEEIPEKAIAILSDCCDVEYIEKGAISDRNAILRRIQNKDGVFCMVDLIIDKELCDAAGPNFKVIGTMSVGYDHIDLSEVKSRKIKVGYTPDVLTDATAELTISLLLATTRRLFEANAELRLGRWHSWTPMWMAGYGLSHSTVGIFGLGRIGHAVLKRLKGFNVNRFIYSSRSRKSDEIALDAEYVSFDTLLLESDFIIVTCSLTKNTQQIFNKSAFEKMKKKPIFINTSRGGLVDQDALINALKQGTIRAAGLDVMTPEPLPKDHPLIQTPNLTLLPHIGSAEVGTRENMAILTATNIVRALNNEPMPAQLC